MKNELFNNWVNCSQYTDEKICFTKFAHLTNPTEDQDPLVKIMSLIIQKDRTYEIFVLGRRVNLSQLGLPKIATDRDLIIISSSLESTMKICHGLSNEKFVQYLKRKKGAIKSSKGRLSAYLDTSLEGGIKQDPEYPHSTTIRTTQCTMLVMKNDGDVCKFCTQYARNLKIMANRPTAGLHITVYILT